MKGSGVGEHGRNRVAAQAAAVVSAVAVASVLAGVWAGSAAGHARIGVLAGTLVWIAGMLGALSLVPAAAARIGPGRLAEWERHLGGSGPWWWAGRR